MEVQGELIFKCYRFPNGMQNDMLSFIKTHYPKFFKAKVQPKRATFIELISS